MKRIISVILWVLNLSLGYWLIAEQIQDQTLKDILKVNTIEDLEVFSKKYSDSDMLPIFKMPFDKNIPLTDRKVVIKVLSKLSKDKYINMYLEGLKMRKIEDDIKFELLSNALHLCLEKESTIDDKDADKFAQGIATSLDTTKNIKLKNAMRKSAGVIINREVYSKLSDTAESRGKLINDILYDTGETIFSKLAKVKVINKEYLQELVATLSDIDPKVRMKAAIELKDATGKDFGFNPVADQIERDDAIKRYLEYIENLQP